MDSVYYQTLSLPDACLVDLANNKVTRNQFDEMLRKYGEHGWRAYQIAETEAGLLVFLLKVN